jgi:hypothetical protein
MNRLFRQPERLARWAMAVTTYWTDWSYVERGRHLYPLLFADAVTRAMRRAAVSCALDVGRQGRSALELGRNVSGGSAGF